MDGSATIVYLKEPRSVLKVPTLTQLLACTFKDRQHLLFPWLREQESCMVYADTGVGKSMFALSAALAVAGGGEFLGWKSEERAAGGGWRVLYIDGEMHIADIQERARLLLDAVPGLDRGMVGENLSFLARQHQDPDAEFPLITEPEGMRFIQSLVRKGALDLVILDNFSTLGEVEDENAASSFNSIQQFLLHLKVQGVATTLVHHAGKSGDAVYLDADQIDA
jgi:RecA-family ATPase